MNPLKPFFFTLKLLLLLFSLSTQPLSHANTQNLNGFNIEQVTHNNNNNSFGSEYDDTINRTPFTIESQIFANQFRYLMKFGVKIYDGDLLPTDAYAIPDTGSDLIWLYGKPCKPAQGRLCYCEKRQENKVAWIEKPILKKVCIEKPKDRIYCNDPTCNALKKIHIRPECAQENFNGLCKYSSSSGYEDDTELKGIYGLANFLFTMDKSENNGNDQIILKIGFSTITKKKDVEEPKSQGIVGLGLGELSLINQYKGITPKFSYYLPQFHRKDEKDIKARSKFKLGDGVDFKDEKSTPLLTKKDHFMCQFRYCVQLLSIFVGESENNKIAVSDDAHQNHKVMIIDSGYTFTHLSKNIFDKFLEKVKKELRGKNLEPKGKDYKHCFEKDGKVENLLKKISFEFKDKKIELKRENFLDDYSHTESNGEQKHYLCLTVEGENEKYHQRLRNYGGKSNVLPHILGSRAQMDFFVAFDLRKNKEKVSFESYGNKNKHIEVLSE